MTKLVLKSLLKDYTDCGAKRRQRIVEWYDCPKAQGQLLFDMRDPDEDVELLLKALARYMVEHVDVTFTIGQVKYALDVGVICFRGRVVEFQPELMFLMSDLSHRQKLDRAMAFIGGLEEHSGKCGGIRLMRLQNSVGNSLRRLIGYLNLDEQDFFTDSSQHKQFNAVLRNVGGLAALNNKIKAIKEITHVN